MPGSAESSKVNQILKDAQYEFDSTPFASFSNAGKDFTCVIDPSNPLNPIGDPLALLDQLKERIHLLETLKFPNPPYECKRVMIDVDGVRTSVLYVKCVKDLKTLSDEQRSTMLNTMENTSILIRKLSILAGMLKGFTSKPSTHYATNRIDQIIFDAANQAIKEVGADHEISLVSIIQGTPSEIMQDFVGKLTTAFADAQPVDPRAAKLKLIEENNKILDKHDKNYIKLEKHEKKYIEDELAARQKQAVSRIRNAEKYFVADLNSNRYIINESVIETKIKRINFLTGNEENETRTIVQLDVPFNNTLTAEQLAEFEELKNNRNARNKWYSNLEEWEKDQIVAATMSSNGVPFKHMFQSSAMQNLPGVKNARTNYLIQRNRDGTNTLLARSLKTATQVPYETPARFHAQLARMNVDQLLEQTTNGTQDQFTSLWGDILPTTKPVIYFQSLLSDVKFDKDAKILVDAQEDAIFEMRQNKKYRDKFTIFQGNDPVNFLRWVVGKKKSLASKIGRTESWEHAYELGLHAKKFRKSIKDSLAQDPKLNLTTAQEKNLKLNRMAISALVNLRDKDEITSRNRAAFKAAYMGLLVESMGGTVISNCKSGKDRTGLDELYRHAMRMYFELYGTLPLYDDNSKKRKNFISIFVQLFNTMKTQDAAAANTPGSFGIKDSAIMLCLDINRALKKSYDASCDRSNINKPKQFTRNESEEKKALQANDAEYNIAQSKLYQLVNEELATLPTSSVSCNIQAFRNAYLGILKKNNEGGGPKSVDPATPTTRLDNLYQEAMLLYFKENNLIPKHDDPPQKRKLFVAIFVKLFTSIKTHNEAFTGIQYSFGIKPDKSNICPDIAVALSEPYRSLSEKSNHSTAPLNLGGLSARKAATTTTTLFAPPQILDFTAFTKTYNIERFSITRDELKDNTGDIYTRKVGTPYSAPLKPGELAINFVKNSINPALPKAVYLEERDKNGHYKVTGLKLPADMEKGFIFGNLLAKSDLINNITSGNNFSIWDNYPDHMPTLEGVKKHLQSSGVSFKKPLDELAKLLMAEYAEKTTQTVTQTVNGKNVEQIIPSPSYLEFAYKQYLSFQAQNGKIPLSIVAGVDPLLASSYEVICQSHKYNYSKSDQSRKLTLSTEATTHVKNFCDAFSPASSKKPPASVHSLRPQGSQGA